MSIYKVFSGFQVILCAAWINVLVKYVISDSAMHSSKLGLGYICGTAPRSSSW